MIESTASAAVRVTNMIKTFVQDGIPFTIELQKQGEGFYIGISEEGKPDIKLPVETAQILNGDTFSIQTAAGETKGRFYFAGDEVYVHIAGQTFRMKSVSPADLETNTSNLHRSPMPGKVIAVQVAVGDSVQKDQTIVIVEAMKMENAIKATLSGKVKAVHCKVGDLVSPDLNLVELEGS